MRIWAIPLAFVLTPGLHAGDKLTEQDRIELMRGLSSEFATVKQYLPRSKKALPFDSKGTYDKKVWEDYGREYGPAGRVGDSVQITKVTIYSDKLILQINGGFKGGHKWYENVQIGTGATMTPIAANKTNMKGGTTIEVLFHKAIEEPMNSADVKKLLAPVLDFEKRTATMLYAEVLTPEVKQAIHEKKALVGMDRDQVLLAMGHPNHKSRETIDGVDTEDWVFGQPPGKITFVKFQGTKVVKVKEEYAGLGTEVAPPQVQ